MEVRYITLTKTSFEIQKAIYIIHLNMKNSLEIKT